MSTSVCMIVFLFTSRVGILYGLKFMIVEKGPLYNVERDVSSSVPEVCRIVYGWTTCIPCDAKICACINVVYVYVGVGVGRCSSTSTVIK